MVWIHRENKNYGPISADTLKQWIADRRVGPGDRIVGGNHADWISLEVSDYRDILLGVVNLDRTAATTCPRCGGPLTMTSSSMGLFLIIIGIVLFPVGVGIPIWVIGMWMRHGNKAKKLACTRCGYRPA